MGEVLLIAAVLLVIAGLIGMIVPGIPGVLLVYAGLVCAAGSDGFARVGWITLGILLLLAIAAMALDFLTASYGARRTGASRWAAVGAAGGTLIGLFFGIPGIILGPFLGAVLLELLVRKDFLQAGKAGVGTWLGLLVGVALKFALVFMMIGIFALAWFV
jgi:uncharacterized protein YqgC (DUF456 family)